MENINSNSFFSQFRLKPVFLLASLLLVLLFSSTSKAIANTTDPSIEIISFPTGMTYFRGGSISVLFEPKGIFPLNNVFRLEMSDASGNFTNATVIATKEEFFVPVLNGIIPAGTAIGGGYKLRISYGPLSSRSFYEIPTTFQIDTAPSAFEIPFIVPDQNSASVQVRCLDDPNTQTGNVNNFFGGFNNSQGSTLNESLKISQPSSGNWDGTQIKMFSLNSSNQWVNQSFTINTSVSGAKSFTILNSTPVGYHLIEFTKDFGGKKLSYSYVFNLNTGNTGIGNLTNENVCINTNVDFVVTMDQMKSNYPGSKYTINFGDGSAEETYTHAYLLANRTLSPRIPKFHM